MKLKNKKLIINRLEIDCRKFKALFIKLMLSDSDCSNNNKNLKLNKNQVILIKFILLFIIYYF